VTIVLLLVIRYVLVPQFDGAAGALEALAGVSLPLILLGLVLEAVSLVCYSALTRAALNPHNRPGFFTILRIDLVGLGINNAVPAGGPTATALRFRMLTRAGMRFADAASGTTIEVSTSVLAIGGIFGLGVVLSLSAIRENPYYLVAGGVVCAVAILALALTALLERFREGTLRVVAATARRLPFLSEESATSLVAAIAEDLQRFRSDPRRIAVTAAWAAANWLLDAAALWVFVLAFGYSVDLRYLLVVYGLASILGMLPITPGGLGIVEGVLVPSLIAFGAPHGAALLGVISWRLVEFWCPLPVAGLAYLSLRARVLRPAPADAATPAMTSTRG
jgi:uncharacterized protein (TIRG00374 family)